MKIKWVRVMKEDRTLKSYLIGYSKNNKEHVYFLNESIKYMQRKDCIRIITTNGDLE